MHGSAELAAPDWVPAVRRTADAIRRRVLEHVLANDGGYLSQACCAGEILATLYLRTMRLGPSVAPRIPPPFLGVPSRGSAHATGGGYHGPRAPDLDRFFLSPAHYALVLYTALIEVGRMAPEALAQFNKDGSTVEMIGAEHSPGFEMMGGSLAQTLSQSAGIALARKRRGDRGRVWVFLSDGEFQEGQTWEALQAMAFYALDNLGVYVDVNGHQCDGPTDEVMRLDPLAQRIEAFGCRVATVDGHDPAALDAPAKAPPDGRPLVVLCRTDPCHGIPLLEKRRPRFHYLRFVSAAEREEYRRFYAASTAPSTGAR